MALVLKRIRLPFFGEHVVVSDHKDKEDFKILIFSQAFLLIGGIVALLVLLFSPGGLLEKLSPFR